MMYHYHFHDPPHYGADDLSVRYLMMYYWKELNRERQPIFGNCIQIKEKQTNEIIIQKHK